MKAKSFVRTISDYRNTFLAANFLSLQPGGSQERRRANETLRNLHSDIRRLAALALPELEHRARETMACDYFIDALDDPNLALKIRERFPKDLDAALQIALQLEVWSKDADKSHPENTRKERKTRQIAKPEKKDEQNDVLK